MNNMDTITVSNFSSVQILHDMNLDIYSDININQISWQGAVCQNLICYIQIQCLKKMSKTSDIVQTGGWGSGGQWSNFRTSFSVFLNNMLEPSLGIIFHKIAYTSKNINEWNNFYFPKKCSIFLLSEGSLGGHKVQTMSKTSDIVQTSGNFRQ